LQESWAIMRKKLSVASAGYAVVEAPLPITRSPIRDEEIPRDLEERYETTNDFALEKAIWNHAMQLHKQDVELSDRDSESTEIVTQIGQPLGPAGSELPTLLSEGAVYNIVQIGKRYVAIHRSIGPVDLMLERLGEREIGDYILLADRLADIERRVAERAESNGQRRWFARRCTKT